jgi:putative CocE/NonD family hydrolase
MLARITGGFDFPLDALTNGTTGGPLAFDGPFYRLRSPITKIDQVDVPTFITGGLWDLFQRGEPQLYNALRLPPGEKQLLIGPWYHITTGSGLGVANTPPTLDDLALAWFDRWVKGVHNGIEHFGPVTLYQLGSERWTTQGSYPGAGVRYQRMYLTADKSGSARSINDGTLAPMPPSAAATDTVLANPINGLCSRSTEQWTAGLVTPGAQCTDQNSLNEASGLTYTTAAASAPLQLTGQLSLTLQASTTAQDTTWIATLTDVAPDGSSRPLTAGWLMPSRRAVDRVHSMIAPAGDLVIPWHPFTQATLEPVVAGETETLNVEIFPTDAVIEPGHRLRLVLTHGDVPHMLAATPDALNSIGAVDSVHIDPTRPSFLTLPVAGPAPTTLPFVLRASCESSLARIALRRRRHDRIVAATVFIGRRRHTVRGRDLRSVVVGTGGRTKYVRIVERTAKGRHLTLLRVLRGCP